MKTAVFQLIFALCFMWYRGDFGALPEEFGLPSMAGMWNWEAAHKESKLEPVDTDKLFREASRKASPQELVVKDAKVKPKILEVFIEQKSSLVT